MIDTYIYMHIHTQIQLNMPFNLHIDDKF